MDGGRLTAADFVIFQQYMTVSSGSTSNTRSINRMKSAIKGIINDHTTEKQREYLLAYFFDGLNVREIGELHGVNKATVSRGIHRGMRRVYRQLLAVEPSMKDTPMIRCYISNNI